MRYSACRVAPTNITISTATGTDADTGRSIAVRVLAHPDPSRVGDFTPLFDAGMEDHGRLVEINRLTPEFRTSVGERTGPLDSGRITRSPLQVARNASGLSLHYAASAPPVEVNGVLLTGERAISARELETGVVIQSGRDLALWIGWLDQSEPAPPVAGLIGESSVMRKLRQQIHRVADLEVPVLLRGATGVGKELVAAAIHRHSRRAAQNYVAVNVAGVPPSMAASELFGHTRGAFTGAFENRKGYFAQADGGTLFLDEIGDVSFDVQALLLRAVQEGVIQPLGGTTRHVDVRLVAATDSDLESAVARREFREPLLRRFSYEIHVPPLRARRDDIGLLFFHFLRERLESMGEGHRLAARPIRGERSGGGGDREQPFVPASYVARLALHDWPGNVRELANVALRFAVENRGLARARIGDELRDLLRPRSARVPSDLTFEVEDPVAKLGNDVAVTHERPTPASRQADGVPSSPTRRAEPDDGEILAALLAEEFRRERAAKRLGVSKSYLYKRLEKTPLVPIASEISAEDIRSALAASGGDVASAARQLRISPRALRLQLKRARAPVS